MSITANSATVVSRAALVCKALPLQCRQVRSRPSPWSASVYRNTGTKSSTVARKTKKFETSQIPTLQSLRPDEQRVEPCFFPAGHLSDFHRLQALFILVFDIPHFMTAISSLFYFPLTISSFFFSHLICVKPVAGASDSDKLFDPRAHLGLVTYYTSVCYFLYTPVDERPSEDIGYI